METYPFYIAGVPNLSAKFWQCKDVYSGEIFAEVAVAEKPHIQKALKLGLDAKSIMAGLKAYEKRNILLQIKEKLEERLEPLAKLITAESGKTINESRAEMLRAVSTFEYAAIEVMQQDGSILSMDTHPSSEDYECLIKRYPKGLCSFITPFNFPINLIAHKIAPAIAAGCPFIVKPSDKTPLCALEIGKILAESELPNEAFSILPCSIEDSLELVTDQKPSYLSFTGSDKVGWKLKELSGKKAVCLELGGTAACAIYPDSDIEATVDDVVRAAFSQAGQSCISLQHLYIHENIYDKFKKQLIKKSKEIIPENPHLESSKLGPMISSDALNQAETLIKNAIDCGAKRLSGEKLTKNLLSPTIIESLTEEALLQTHEAFAPILIIHQFSDTDQLFNRLNSSPYGIHLGLYSKDIQLAFKAWDKLECAGIVIGQVPTWRSDKMPYGGIKNSGIGREGIKFAIEEMTEIKTLTIKKR